MEKEQFGKLLVSLRTQRGMSQKEAAALLSVSPSAVSKWEHGSNLPDIAMLDKIALLMEVSCDELLNPERTLEQLDSGKRTFAAKPQGVKKRVFKLAPFAAALILLGILGISRRLICSPGNSGEGGFKLFDARYTEDSHREKMYEIAFVTSGERDRSSIHTHMDEISDLYRPGKEIDEDTVGIRVYYYDNEADAAEWFPVNFGGIIYFEGSGNKN